MARIRSPNYPSVSLVKAIELAHKVYLREHTHKAHPETVAKAIGYTGLNGASLGAISALKKYGLLEEVGKELKISADALTILVDPVESLERAEAIKRCAFAPALFSELQKQYGDTLPSDENIRSFLLRKGFSPATVDGPIRSYRETMHLVSDLSGTYNNAGPQEEQKVESQVAAPTEQHAGPKNPGFFAASPHQLGEGIKQDVFSLEEGQVVIQWPSNMSASSFEDVRAWLDILERKISRSVKKDDDD